MDHYDVFMRHWLKGIELEEARVYLKRCKEMAVEREHKGLEDKVNL